MSKTRSNPHARAATSAKPLQFSLTAAIALLSLCVTNAHALSSDRDQPLSVKAQYQKSMMGNAKAGEAPDATILTGNVRMQQGSLKASGDEAHIYDVSKPGDQDSARRLVLTGKPAQLEQLMDNNGGKMNARATKIDYDTGTGIAELTGDVVVIQEGRSEFRGPRMTYNTNTGAMEGGSQSPGSEINMIFQPKPKAPKPATEATP
jgi:lipopolysaccharide export system protein LptA